MGFQWTALSRPGSPTSTTCDDPITRHEPGCGPIDAVIGSSERSSSRKERGHSQRASRLGVAL